MNPESDPLLEESLILTLFDVVNYMTRNGEIMARKGDLTVQQWLVLLQIDNDPGFPKATTESEINPNGILASSIANARGVSRANISTLVAVLLRKKLVRQIEDPNDRRRKFLSITTRGKKALEQIEPVRRRFNAALFAEFSNGELGTVHEFLTRCLEELWRLSEKQIEPMLADAASALKPDE